MANLKTKYMGMELKSPIIVGSSGLTSSVDNIKTFAQNGAGAVVLKSLFEEQIHAEVFHPDKYSDMQHPETIDYVSNYTENRIIENYLKLIEKAKKAVDIPVIASINCYTDTEWIYYANKIKAAGADAVELNISFLPSNDEISAEQYEQLYFKITEKVKTLIQMPIALKMSYYSSGLASLIKKLDWAGNTDSFVLFNKFFSVDVDIEKLEVVPANKFSSPEDMSTTLRWIAILSKKIQKQLVACTGIHDADGVIKQLLVGATAVEMVSAIYKNGANHIKTVIQGIEKWMESKNYSSIDDFRGKLISNISDKPEVFERIQFMKYYGGIN